MRLKKPARHRHPQSGNQVYAHEAYAAAADNTSASSVNTLHRGEDKELSESHRRAMSNVLADMLATAGVSAAATRDPNVIIASSLIVGARSVQTNCLSCHTGN